MPLSYPLPLATFADSLLVAEASCELPEQLAQSRTAGGEQLTADLAERLWTGRINIGAQQRHEVGVQEVLVSLLGQAGRTFLMYDRRRPNPLLDPTGSILGAASVTILALGGDPRELSLTGLPVGYTLSRGDYLSFAYTSLAVSRQALHRVVDATVVANGSGQTALFEVEPFIRPGAVTGAAVTLRKAFCKAVKVAGSGTPNTGRSSLSEGLGFDWVQSLR
ncbi:hypothetical protein [Tabrizicola sp.]|uniref:hypothetical protein n=1 Tax=Tabrizicola sp. TaxID=2005166 RepID=UPI0025CC0CE5|nr:hypothetical protein [Tabrizicola sp.]